MAFCMASNPIKNWCDNDYQARLLESFNYIFGMDIYLNESSYYYDLIIPEPCYLERYDPLPLSFNNHRVPGIPEVPFIVVPRIPVVPAKDDCPSALDTFGALAEKAGKTAEYAERIERLLPHRQGACAADRPANHCEGCRRCRDEIARGSRAWHRLV